MNFKTFIQESINDAGTLKAIFLGGFPGSGKSYVLSKVTSGLIEPRIVNTDRVLEYYGSLSKVDLSQPLDTSIIDSATLLTQKMLYNYINGILPLAIDSTSSNSKNLLLRHGALESIGYDTGMIYINTSLDTAIERAKQRDRKVSESFIREVHDNIIKMKPFYKSKFKFFIEINNDAGELTNEVIMRAFNKVTEFYSEPVENPVGVDLLERMKVQKEKYLLPNMISEGELRKVVSLWYRR